MNVTVCVKPEYCTVFSLTKSRLIFAKQRSTVCCHIRHTIARILSTGAQALSLAPAVLMGSGPYPDYDLPSMALVTLAFTHNVTRSPLQQLHKWLTSVFVFQTQKMSTSLSFSVCSLWWNMKCWTVTEGLYLHHKHVKIVINKILSCFSKLCLS